MLLILRENLSPERTTFASVVMATASTGGKFIAIGVCAIFAIDKSIFMYCFLTAGILLFAVAAVFLFATGRIKGVTAKEKTISPQENDKTKAHKKSIILLVVLGEFSLASYAIAGALYLIFSRRNKEIT